MKIRISFVFLFIFTLSSFSFSQDFADVLPDQEYSSIVHIDLDKIDELKLENSPALNN